MTQYRLLDADFLINLVRTLSIIQKYDSSTAGKIEQICDECRYSLISTNFVKTEVSNKINLKNPKDRDKFFEPRKKEALKIQKDIFKKVRIIDLSRNPFMSIYKGTRSKNLGEKSLVVLLTSKYSGQVNSGGDSVKIVSNNTSDVLSYLYEMKRANSKLSFLDASSLIMPNYEFYYDLFTQLVVRF